MKKKKNMIFCFLKINMKKKINKIKLFLQQPKLKSIYIFFYFGNHGINTKYILSCWNQY